MDTWSLVFHPLAVLLGALALFALIGFGLLWWWLKHPVKDSPPNEPER